MGMFDVVVFDLELPGVALKGRRFQTKSFENCMDLYTVTEAGRLCLTGNELFGEEEPAAAPVDIDFHGDMRMIAEEGHDSYIVRFTHGALEWVQPDLDLPNAELKAQRVYRDG